LKSVLLRFLETGAFVGVGGTQPVQARTRVLAALNVAVDEVERRGLVRSDLLYRLNCLTIDIPPLRERREDIRPIAEKSLREELHFLGQVGGSLWTALAACPYPWPGNARGLRNVLLKAILASSSERLTADDLPTFLWQEPPASTPTAAAIGDGDGRAARVAEDVRALQAVLRASDHNVSEAARRLGVHPSPIYPQPGRPSPPSPRVRFRLVPARRPVAGGLHLEDTERDHDADDCAAVVTDQRAHLLDRHLPPVPRQQQTIGRAAAGDGVSAGQGARPARDGHPQHLGQVVAHGLVGFPARQRLGGAAHEADPPLRVRGDHRLADAAPRGGEPGRALPPAG